MAKGYDFARKAAIKLGELGALGVSTQDAFIVHKFGKNPDVDDVEEVIQISGGTLGGDSFPENPISLEVLSSSGNDTELGSGATHITIRGFDANNAAVNTEVALDGITPVAIPGTWLRVPRTRMKAGGYYARNAGTLTVRVAGGGNNVLQVAAGRGSSQEGWWHVEAGWTCFLYGAFMTIDTGKTATIYLNSFKTDSDNMSVTELEWDGITAPIDFNPTIPYKFEEKTDIVWTAISGVNANAVITVDFVMLMIKNEVLENLDPTHFYGN